MPDRRPPTAGMLALKLRYMQALEKRKLEHKPLPVPKWASEEEVRERFARQRGEGDEGQT